MKDRLVNIFRLDEQLVALPLGVIKQIVRSAKLKSIQGLPTSILGILNLHGELIPVIDVRHHLGLELKRLTLEDRFVIISSEASSIAIVVSEVLDILKMNDLSSLDLSTLSLQSEVESLTCLNDDIVMILNAEQLLSDSDLDRYTKDFTLTDKKKLSA